MGSNNEVPHKSKSKMGREQRETRKLWDILKHTICEFVWCGMICQRRPNSLYDGHARLVDTGLPYYVRALHQSEPDREKQLPQPVRPCHDPRRTVHTKIAVKQHSLLLSYGTVKWFGLPLQTSVITSYICWYKRFLTLSLSIDAGY